MKKSRDAARRVNRKRVGLATAAAIIVIAALGYWLVFAAFSRNNGSTYVYIHPGDTRATVWRALAADGAPRQMVGIRVLATVMGYSKVRPGRYDVGGGISSLGLLRRLRNGQQAPVRLTVHTLRTVDDIAAWLGNALMPDSADFAAAFRDTALLHTLDCDTATVPCLFIPDTYEVFWTVTPQELLQRMQKESRRYWTDERRRRAAEAGLSTDEVITVASIVDQETANVAEMPMVAGMYLNRLHQGMKLQADPTVKFALRDFALRRIMQKHLAVDSPYNTYRYEGLPPGPICIPSKAAIEAVLGYAHHDYLYMCAKEDFSGTHNFAITYAEHLQNAARYAQALNARNIH